MHKYDSIVTGALDLAQAQALSRGHSELHQYHLLFGLFKHPSSFFSRAAKSEKKQIEKLLASLPTVSQKLSLDQMRPSAKLGEWLTLASSHSIQAGRQEITETDLLRYMPQILGEFQFDYEKLNEAQDEGEQEELSFLIDLNEMAQAGKLDPVIGRTKEIRAVMEILGRRNKNNPVLVGPAGVGKTAIVEGLADAIVKGNVPDVLEGKTVYSLDLGSLMAGTKYRGEFEERLQKLLKFIKSKAGEAILFIDEIHQLVGAGKTEGAMDAANLLKPALARGELNCIGATTTDEYQKYILGDSALDRRFRSVPVHEPSKEDAIEILMGIREKLEAHHGIKISDEAVYNSVILSSQYINDKNLPDKAIDLVDEAAAALKLAAEAMPAKLEELNAEIRSKKILAQVNKDDSQEIAKNVAMLEEEFNRGKEEWERQVLSMKQVSDLKNQLDRLKFELEQAERDQDYENAGKLKYSLIPELQGKLEETQHNFILSKENVAQVISRQKGIPVEKILKSEQENILQLEGYLKSRVFGQEQALQEVANTLITSHAGLSEENRPLGSFLLKGPSGVGKTETAKSVCEFLFDTQENMIRIDLSEFSEKHSVAKLIGAPAGYVGYDEGGILTEAVRRRPYSVILFDEIEKAHKDFSDILLQILDDGRLTDNKGRIIDFKNTIIFITTNSKDLHGDFKPEVLGRIDGVLEYNQLTPEILNGLVETQIEKLNQRLGSKKVKVQIGEALKEKVKQQGFDPLYGARPLRSTFERLVTRPLSRKVVAGQMEEGEYLLDIVEGSSQISLEKLSI